MGTLFELTSSVGEIYQKFASKYGVKIDAKILNQTFVKSYQAAPPLAFPAQELEIVAQQEFLWWKNVVQKTFLQAEALTNFSNFTDFFSELYAYFTSKEPWYIFPDVIPCLQNCQRQGIELGVISNFDSRLNQVLKALDLEQFFTSITISSIAGFAKPDQDIFKIALKKHGFNAQQAWHIGDSLKEDYQGAKNLGINSFWLNRNFYLLSTENQLPNLCSLG
jgi:putative hydrolase of the HAD superfamily